MKIFKLFILKILSILLNILGSPLITQSSNSIQSPINSDEMSHAPLKRDYRSPHTPPLVPKKAAYEEGVASAPQLRHHSIVHDRRRSSRSPSSTSRPPLKRTKRDDSYSHKRSRSRDRDRYRSKDHGEFERSSRTRTREVTYREKEKEHKYKLSGSARRHSR